MLQDRLPSGVYIMGGHSSVASTPASLLLRIRDPRDAEAWKTFVEVYGRLVYRHCCSRGLHHEDAENVTQEVFARVSQAVRRFEYQPELGRFRDWLGTLTRNEISRFLKKEVRAAQGLDEEAADSIESRGEDTAWTEEFNAHLLTSALARSRPHFEGQTWRAFELVWLEKRSAAQVADELQVPIDRVYVAKSRVLERLQQEVQQLAEDSILFGR
jgi:RNA polymerase sigma-70 factor (ECF subfamily)